ncbi:MAG: redox-regulated ATPase YchF [Fidelibacterota bacterium]
MSLQCGFIGLPNVGKSTLFSALTHSQVETAVYPFTTIESNVGIVPVPDDRLTRLSGILKPEKVIPTTVRMVDIAGLIEGSHHGDGLGNQFLAQIREVDAIIHVVRCFTNDQVSHIDANLDPSRDIDIVETEIILKDLETVTIRLERLTKKIKMGDEDALKETEVLHTVTHHLDRGIPARKIQLDENQGDIVRNLFLLSAKPVLYVGNENEEEATSHHPGAAAKALLAWGKQNGKQVIILSALLEQELAFLENDRERRFFMEEWGLETAGLDLLVKEAYGLLNLASFFTTESNHAQAWTVRQGTPAPQAGGTIHSDFETGFIKVEVYTCRDLFAYGSVTALREHGLIHTHGKDYVVQDGDVVKFHFKV